MSFGIDSWLQALLWASFYGAVLALGVLLVQMALRRHVPARWRFGLWLIVLVRFVPMAGVESRWSPFNWLPHAQAEQARESQQQGSPVGPAPSVSAPSSVVGSQVSAPMEVFTPGEAVATRQAPAEVSPAVAPFWVAAPIVSPAAMPRSPISVWSLVYGLGAGIVVVRLLLATLSLARIVRRATRVEDPSVEALLRGVCGTMGVRKSIPLLATDDLASPAVVGFFQPKLLLPRGLIGRLTADELRLVFLHEAAHIRRRDVLLNYVLAALDAVHWFNPVVWMMAGRIRAERELACDEMVLLQTGDPAPYGHTLLKLLETAGPARSLAPAVGIVETRRFFTRRIRMIAAFRKRPVWIVVPVVLAAAVAASCALTGPVTRGGDSTPADVPARPTTPEAAPTPTSGASSIENPFSSTGTTAAAGTPIPAPGSAGATPLSLQDQAAAKLNTPLKMHFVEAQLKDVLQYVADNTGVNVHVNWNALSGVGIDRATPVSADLSDVPARKALQLILGDVGGGGGKVDFLLDEGVLSISTREDLAFIAARAKNPAGNNTAAVIENDKRYADASLMVAMLTKQLAELNAGKAPAEQQEAVERQLVMAQAMLADAARKSSANAAVADSATVALSAREKREAYQADLAAKNAAREAATPAPRASDSLSASQARLDQVAAQRDQARAALDALMQKLGPNHPEVAAAQTALNALQSRIDALQSQRDLAMKEAARPTPPTQVQVYDVHDLLDVPATQQGVLTAEQQTTLKDLVVTIDSTLNEPDLTVSAFNGMLVVKAPDKVQNEVREVLGNLQDMHHARAADVKERLLKEAPEKH